MGVTLYTDKLDSDLIQILEREYTVIVEEKEDKIII